MARPPRLDFPGARHHAYNRAARREHLFTSDSHCLIFTDILAGLPERFGVLIHGYALMPNHYHLMLETPRANLSQVMRHFGAEMTQALNALNQGWDGPVFRGRFHNRVVEDDGYWRHLLAYLHLNPVRGGLARTVDESRWTSHGAYAGHTPIPSWLTTQELLTHHGGRAAYLDYLVGLRQGSVSPPTHFDEERLWIPAKRTDTVVTDTVVTDTVVTDTFVTDTFVTDTFVTDTFVTNTFVTNTFVTDTFVTNTFVTNTFVTNMQRRSRLGKATALKQVVKVTGLQPAQLKLPKMGPGGNPGRRVLAWWWVYACGLTQAQAGKDLGASAAQVSRWCTDIRKGRVRNAQLAKWVGVLKAGRARDTGLRTRSEQD
jgi:REP element-mobilizing transposase RayT